MKMPDPNAPSLESLQQKLTELTTQFEAAQTEKETLSNANAKLKRLLAEQAEKAQVPPQVEEEKKTLTQRVEQLQSSIKGLNDNLAKEKDLRQQVAVDSTLDRLMADAQVPQSYRKGLKLQLKDSAKFKAAPDNTITIEREDGVELPLPDHFQSFIQSSDGEAYRPKTKSAKTFELGGGGRVLTRLSKPIDQFTAHEIAAMNPDQLAAYHAEMTGGE